MNVLVILQQTGGGMRQYLVDTTPEEFEMIKYAHNQFFNQPYTQEEAVFVTPALSAMEMAFVAEEPPVEEYPFKDWYRRFDQRQVNGINFTIDAVINTGLLTKEEEPKVEE